jgi:hypothetical protein
MDPGLTKPDPELVALDYGRPEVAANGGYSDGRMALLLTLCSPLALFLSVFGYLWFVAIVWYGTAAVRKTRGRSILGWIGLVYGTAVCVGSFAAMLYMLGRGR